MTEYTQERQTEHERDSRRDTDNVNWSVSAAKKTISAIRPSQSNTSCSGKLVAIDVLGVVMDYWQYSERSLCLSGDYRSITQTTSAIRRYLSFTLDCNYSACASSYEYRFLTVLHTPSSDTNKRLHLTSPLKDVARRTLLNIGKPILRQFGNFNEHIYRGIRYILWRFFSFNNRMS